MVRAARGAVINYSDSCYNLIVYNFNKLSFQEKIITFLFPFYVNFVWTFYKLATVRPYGIKFTLLFSSWAVEIEIIFTSHRRQVSTLYTSIYWENNHFNKMTNKRISKEPIGNNMICLNFLSKNRSTNNRVAQWAV